jgi:hypothetical protein
MYSGQGGRKMTNSQKMVSFVREQLGELYDIGDHGPDLWDCSGLTMEAAELVGKKWLHSSHSQYYSNKDLPEYGETSNMPRDKNCIIFRYGERTSGKGLGMIHVGLYAADKQTQIQAGGNGPIVNKEVYLANLAAGMSKIDAVNNSLSKNHPGGTKKSVVWEDAFSDRHFTHWRRGDWMDEEYSENAPESPTDPQESPYPTLRKGDGFPDVVKGEHVKTLQNLLNQHGAKLNADGKFGALTYQAVRDYQEENGLFVDGVVGSKTWGALLAEEPQEDTAWDITIRGLTTEERDELLDKFPNATYVKQS